MSQVSQNKTLHANNVEVKIGGKTIGRMQDVSIDINTGQDAVRQVGTIEPVELNHNALSIQWRARTFILRKGAVADLNPVNQGPITKMWELPAFDMILLDGANPFLTVRGCELGSNSTQITANQRVMNNVSGMALGILDGSK